MSGRCALRLRQRIHFARKRGILSWRNAAGSSTLAAGHWQVHAPCEAETWNGREQGCTQQAHRCGVLGHKGARRKRLAQRNQPLKDALQEYSDRADDRPAVAEIIKSSPPTVRLRWGNRALHVLQSMYAATPQCVQNAYDDYGSRAHT